MLVNVGLRRTHFQPEPGELGIPFPLGKSYIGKSRSPLVPGSGQWILANTHSIRRTQREQGGSAFRGKRICDTATTTTTTDTTVVEKNGAIQVYRLCPGPLDPLGPLGPLGPLSILSWPSVLEVPSPLGQLPPAAAGGRSMEIEAFGHWR